MKNNSEPEDRKQVQIGGATYAVERVFAGKKTAQELLVERMVAAKQLSEKEQSK